jgi:hypothetical protein
LSRVYHSIYSKLVVAQGDHGHPVLCCKYCRSVWLLVTPVELAYLVEASERHRETCTGTMAKNLPSGVH